MTRVRVVHYNHTGVIAGAERVLLNALPQLRDEGLQSIVLSPAGPLQSEAARSGFEVVECYPLEARFTSNPVELAKCMRSFAISIRSLRMKLRCLQPDVVHANSVRAGLVASAATVGMRTGVVWHVHDTLPRHPLSVAIRGFAAMSRRTSLIAVSRATARTFCGRLWKRRLAPKTDVLHNIFAGVRVGSTAQQRDRLRGELGATGRFLVGCVGQICKRKNQIAMVGAFAEVLKCSPEALLLIVGSALFPCNVPYEVSVRQKIEELGISANVLMLGNRDDVPLLLETMDLLVLPSRNEPFPMILLEAMSAATPTVAFAVDGVPELLADRRTAWLVRSGDAVQLARTILWAKKHPEQRRRLASAARVALRKQDTPEIYGKRLASILLKHAYPVQTSSSTAMVESHASQLGETA
jgi:glycosyltransferase involved in cell wall biosynthesis